MTSLQTKLEQLNLTTMSRQLDQIVTDAANRNLSFVHALETLTDLELDSRNNRSVERRFRLSRLHARPSIDTFNFQTPSNLFYQVISTRHGERRLTIITTNLLCRAPHNAEHF